MSSSPLHLDPIVVPLVAGQTVLDVGCGMGKWGTLLASNYYEAGMDSPPVVDGLDVFAPMVAACRSSGRYRQVHQQEVPSTLPGEWDTVLAVEIIEHLAPDKIDAAFASFEAAASKRVIVTTPNWPAFREGLETPLGFSEHEAHLSFVSRGQLRDRGYRLVGSGLGHNPGSLVGRAFRRARVATLAEGLARAIPRISDQIVAYKDL